MSVGTMPRLSWAGSPRNLEKDTGFPVRLSGNTRRARGRIRHFGGAVPPATATPIARIAPEPLHDKRCPPGHFGPMDLDFLTWPATRLSGSRIAGTNLTAVFHRMARLGLPVSAGNADCAAARSQTSRMPYVPQRVSDTIKTGVTMPTAF